MVRRRQLLRAGAPALTLVAGCGAGPGDDTAEPSSSPSPDPAALSAGASVVRGPTADHPLTLEFSLTNDGTRDVRVRAGTAGEPLSAVDRMAPESGDETAKLALVPVDADGVDYGDLTDEPVDGCWRLVDEDGDRRTPRFVSTTFLETLAPGETYAMRHQVRHVGETDTCFPAASYRTTASVSVVEPETRGLELVYTLTVEEGEANVGVEGPEPRSDGDG